MKMSRFLKLVESTWRLFLVIEAVRWETSSTNVASCTIRFVSCFSVLHHNINRILLKMPLISCLFSVSCFLCLTQRHLFVSYSHATNRYTKWIFFFGPKKFWSCSFLITFSAFVLIVRFVFCIRSSAEEKRHAKRREINTLCISAVSTDREKEWKKKFNFAIFEWMESIKNSFAPSPFTVVRRIYAIVRCTLSTLDSVSHLRRYTWFVFSSTSHPAAHRSIRNIFFFLLQWVSNKLNLVFSYFIFNLLEINVIYLCQRLHRT